MTVRLQPHAITLRQLQYLVAVADLCSFRRAAERCGVSQPSLSAQVAEIEGQLGVVVFDRDRRGVQVTGAGAAIVADARRVLQAVDDVVDCAARFRDPLRGTLRIGMLPTIAPYLLPAWSQHLAVTHPALVVLWAEEQTSSIVRKLHARELDAAVVADDEAFDGLARLPIAHDAFVVALPPGHRLADEASVCLEALSEYPLLLLDDGHCLRAQALSLCALRGVREHPFRATSLQTLVQMVAAGVGVTLLPSLAASSEQARSPLVLRPLREGAGRELVLAFRADSPLESTFKGLARDVGVVVNGLVGASASPPSLSRPP